MLCNGDIKRFRIKINSFLLKVSSKSASSFIQKAGCGVAKLLCAKRPLVWYGALGWWNWYIGPCFRLIRAAYLRSVASAHLGSAQASLKDFGSGGTSVIPSWNLCKILVVYVVGIPFSKETSYIFTLEWKDCSSSSEVLSPAWLSSFTAFWCDKPWRIDEIGGWWENVIGVFVEFSKTNVSHGLGRWNKNPG